MSYTIWLTIDTGGERPAEIDIDWNFTSNCAPMFRAAGADLAEMHGKLAGDCVPMLRQAIDELVGDPRKYEELNPPNGWGSYEALVPALERLRDSFGQHPKATVYVSH